MSEPGNRPGRRAVLLLCGLVLVAAAVRLVGLDRGSPELQVDEPIMVEGAGALLEGVRPDVMLGWPGGPQLTVLCGVFAIDLLVSCGPDLLGGGPDRLDVIDRHYARFYREPGRWFVMDRVFSVLLGVLSVVIAFMAASRHMGGRVAGVFAGGLLAVNLLHVEYSHYVLPDVPMTFFFLLTAYLLLRHVEKPSFGALAGAAFAGGLAAATKFNAAPLLVFLVVAALLVRREGGPSWWRRLLTVLGFGFGGLIVGCPWLVTDLPLVLKDFLWRNVYQQAIEGRAGAGSKGGWFHLIGTVLSLRHGVAFGVLLLPALVYGFAGKRKPGLWLASLLVWYIFLLGFSANLSARWLLPAIPLVCILSGGLLTFCLGSKAFRSRWLQGAAVTVGVLLALLSAWQSFDFDAGLFKRSQRSIAKDWVLTHVRHGETVAVEYFAENPLPLDRGGLEERIAVIQETLDRPEETRPDVPVFLYPAVLNEERFELQRARHLLKTASSEGYRILQYGSADRYEKFLEAAKTGKAGVFLLRAATSLRTDRGKKEAAKARARSELVSWLEENAAWNTGNDAYAIYGLRRQSLLSDLE